MRKSKATGFTLLELMITLVIVAIFAGMAVPSFNKQFERSAAQANRDLLFDGIRLARSESIARAMPVSICEANPQNASACQSGSWEDGWVVFTDKNKNGAIDNDDKIIKQHFNEVIGKNLNLDNPVSHITFESQGYAEFGNSANNKVTYRFCYNNGNEAASFVLSKAGYTERVVDTSAGGRC